MSAYHLAEGIDRGAGWIITRDFIDDGEATGTYRKNRFVSVADLKRYGDLYRVEDDDGELYFHATVFEGANYRGDDTLIDLLQYVSGWGATSIFERQGGEWVRVI